MQGRFLKAAALVGNLALSGACGGAEGGPLQESVNDLAADGVALGTVVPHASVDVCDRGAGELHCHAKRRVQDAVTDAATSGPSGGYGPADLASAYNVPASAKSGGALVAVVNAYDDPTAESDLGLYRAHYGLAPCTTANGCFAKVNEQGSASPLPPASAAWSGEISLDLDVVSAMCPDCKILLVEASTPALSDMGAAVDMAASLGAVAISNSYGGSESSGDGAWTTAYYGHPGVLVTASTGDDGYGAGPEFPASSPDVLAVGGTTLVRSASARGWAESAWSFGGAGCSAYTAKPAWQADTLCSRRTAADVSALADPNTGVAVVESGTWQVYGGTSVSSPLIAALFTRLGLAGKSASDCTTSCVPYPYAHASAFNDITVGSDGTCSPSALCTAVAGYDGPTGLGTPNAALLIAPPPADAGAGAIAKDAGADSGTEAGPPPGLQPLTVSAVPSTLDLTAGGGPATTTVTVGGFSTATTLGLSSIPGLTATFGAAKCSPQTCTVPLTLRASGGLAAGTYAPSLTAAGGGINETLALPVTVRPLPGFSLALASPSLRLPAASTPVTAPATEITRGSALLITGRRD